MALPGILGLADSLNEISVQLKLLNGELVDRVISAEGLPTNGLPVQEQPLRALRQNHWPKRDLSPVPSPIDAGAWEHVLEADAQLPLYLRDPNTFYWHEFLSVPSALYIQINANRNMAGKPSLDPYLQGLLAELEARPVDHVIVDVRFNPGGNYALTMPFTEAVPKLLGDGGKVFVVTSANTFSAGLITVARLKHFGGSRTEVVGELVGDDGQFWGEGQRFILPNSRIEIGYATAYHDWENGCSLAQVMDCYFLNYVYGVPAGKLSPSIPANLTFEDYLARRDPSLDAIIAALILLVWR